PSEDSGDDDSDPSYSVTEDEDGHLSFSAIQLPKTMTTS
ncbi:unnamed protein product, partial [Allacma fusca]